MKRCEVESRLTVGFTPAVTSLIDVLADARAVSQGDLIRTAVITMLDAFDGVGDTRAPFAKADNTCPAGEPEDFDPLTGAVDRCAGPRFSEPAQVYIDSPDSERLDELCHAVRLSRARVIRLAVDRYLFDEVTKTA